MGFAPMVVQWSATNIPAIGKPPQQPNFYSVNLQVNLVERRASPHHTGKTPIFIKSWSRIVQILLNGPLCSAHLNPFLKKLFSTMDLDSDYYWSKDINGL
jgi:hypothetical protein